MGLVFSIVQVGIFVAYVVFSVIKAVIPSSFKAPRVGHTAMAFMVMGAAHVLGLPFFLNKLNKAHSYGQLRSIDLSSRCATDYLDECQAAQLVYRASSVLFFFFVLVATAGGVLHYIYANLWPLKSLALIGGFAGMLFLPDPALFGVYAEVARALSLVWMFFQSFLVLDFAHGLHDAIGAKAEEQDAVSGSSSIFSSWWRLLYLFISATCLVASGIGLASLFASHTDCALGFALTGLTLVVGVMATVISLLENVGIGLLPPSVLFAHSTFLCWYAMSNHPNSTCNPWAEDGITASTGKSVGIVLSTGLLACTVAWCAWHGEAVLDLFGVDDDESRSLLSGGRAAVDSRDERREERDAIESRPSRVFFCLVMACASAFASMAMTGWARTDGSPEGLGGRAIPLESVWLKIVAQWAGLLLQMRVLWVTYRDNQHSSSYRNF